MIIKIKMSTTGIISESEKSKDIERTNASIKIQRCLRKKVSLFDYTKKGTQLYYIAKVFEREPYRWLSKPDIEGAWVIDYIFPELSDDDIITMTKKEMCTLWQKKQPGDIQRLLKSVFQKYNQYGLTKEKINSTELQEKRTRL